MSPSLQRSRPTDRLSWLWLATAAALLPFSTLQTIVPLAAWLAPVLLMRFARTRRVEVGLPVVTLVGPGAMALAFRGALLPAPPNLLLSVILVYRLPVAVPFVVDRLLMTRLTGHARMLI